MLISLGGREICLEGSRPVLKQMRTDLSPPMLVWNGGTAVMLGMGRERMAMVRALRALLFGHPWGLSERRRVLFPQTEGTPSPLPLSMLPPGASLANRTHKHHSGLVFPKSVMR